MPSYSLDVNLKTYTVDVDADTPLLWILRDTLDLTGTKFGCGVKQLWRLYGAARWQSGTQLPIANTECRAGKDHHH